MGEWKKMAQSAADLGRIVRAGSYSMAGLRSALRHEAAFRQEILLLAILGPLGVWLGRTGVERALLVGSLIIVLIVELVNSAIETAVNRISEKPHELAGRAKDMASAAVYLSIALVLVTWGLTLAGRYLPI